MPIVGKVTVNTVLLGTMIPVAYKRLADTLSVPLTRSSGGKLAGVAF